MPLGTLDRRAPPLFKQGVSQATKAIVCSLLAVLLMLADGHLGFLRPVRSALQSVIYPVQQLARQPVVWWESVGDHFANLESAQEQTRTLQETLAAQSLRASQVEHLEAENATLRTLLDIQKRVPYASTAAEVVFETSDHYKRSVVVNKGSMHGIKLGSAVVTVEGVLGQVTSVNLHNSEVSLLISDDYTIAVRNARSNERNIAFGLPARDQSQGKMELRYVATNADVQVGDVLTTSGIDGVYPPGMLVATVEHIQKRQDSAYVRVLCKPFAKLNGRQVLIVKPVGLPRADSQTATEAGIDSTVNEPAANITNTSATATSAPAATPTTRAEGQP